MATVAHTLQANTLRNANARRALWRNVAWIWFALGAGALALSPALRGSDPSIGWLPFWLVVAPLIDLAGLRHRELATASRTLLARARRRYRPLTQARRLSRRRAVRLPDGAGISPAQA